MIRLQVLDVGYYHDPSRGPIIRIYGKTKDGSTRVLDVASFRPYFYADVEPGRLEEVSEIVGNYGFTARCVQRYRPVGWQSKPIDMLKIVTKSPRDVSDIREKIKALPDVLDIYEADVLFTTRFMVDSGIKGMGWVDENAKPVDIPENAPLRYMSFDIECLTPEVGFPDASRDPVIMISLAFAPKFGDLSDLVLVADSRECYRNDVEMCGDEHGILARFVEIVKQYDPDILAGFNSNDFDIPYLDKRMTIDGIKPDIGRDGRGWWIQDIPASNSKNVRVPGRIVVDMLRVIRKDVGLVAKYSLKQHNLKTVAKAILGMEKLDVDPKDMRNYWQDRGDNFMKFVSYARRDAVLVNRLMFKLGIMDKYIALSQACGALLQDVVNSGQTVRIENLLLRRFRLDRRVVAMRPQAISADEEEGDLEGATVLDPEKGLHENVLVLDFKSLYPTIIIAHNLCYTTVVVDEVPPDFETDPNGGRFASTQAKPGIVPQILTELLDKRIQLKKAMKSSKDENERAILDAQQYAMKILLNSFYGYAGYARARLYSLTMASAVTGYGRENLLKTKQIIEEDKAFRVVYGDTDSCFVKILNDVDLDDAREIGDELARKVSATLPAPMELNFEAFAKRVLFLSKKRYAMWLFEEQGGVWKDKIKAKGIETVRRDWCRLTTNTLETCLSIILKEGDLDKALDYAKGVIEKLKGDDLTGMIDDLVITKAFNKDASDYRIIPSHVKLALRMKARGEIGPSIGDRVPFVIVKNGCRLFADKAEDPAYALEHGLRIDKDYYVQKQLVAPLGRIFACFGISEKDLTTRGKQVELSHIATAIS